MTNQNLTHITLVADRSGSMQAVLSDAEGGINHFINSQREQPGECTLALIDFDSPSATDWYQIHHWGPIATAPTYKLEPRGSTALLDAVGRAITETGQRLADTPEPDRPGKVVFVVQTDGQENSSREFSWAAVRAMVEHQRDAYGWEFVFLGTGADAWDQGQAMGLTTTTRGRATGQSIASSYAVMDAAVSQYRSGLAADLTAAAVDVDDDGTVVAQPTP